MQIEISTKNGKKIKIASDAMNFTISREVESEGKANHFRIIAYYADVESLLKCLPQRMLMIDSDAETLAELLVELRDYRQVVTQAVA